MLCHKLGIPYENHQNDCLILCSIWSRTNPFLFFFPMVIMCKLSFKVFTLHADVGFLNCYSLFLNLDFSWGFRSFILSLSKEVVSSHAPCTYLVYTLQADVFFHGVFTLSLSKQVLVSYSPCTYLVYTFQSHIVFFVRVFFFRKNYFPYSHSPTRF